MADPAEDGAADVETRGRMLRALRDALKPGSGARRVSGLSLISVLCASAVAPAIGPDLTAWLAATAGVGSNVLADVIMDAIRPKSPDTAMTAEAMELAVAGALEAQMAGTESEAAALRRTVARVLRRQGAQQVLLAALAEGTGEAQMLLAESMTTLRGQFGEFAAVGEGISQALSEIQGSLLKQRELLRLQGERSFEQSLMISRLWETVRRAEAEPVHKSGRQAAWPGNPYRGLHPYGRDQARIFYGRKRLTAELRAALAGRLAGGGLLMVTGASGAGKSSLLSAGLMPEVSQGLLVPGSDGWPCRILTPTSSPLRELAIHLADLARQDPETVWATLKLDPGRAADLAADAVNEALGPQAVVDGPRATAPRLVLIVDQCEQLFTLTSSDEEGLKQRESFVNALNAAATTPKGPANEPPALVVVAVRGDFLDQAFEYPALRKAAERGAFLVGPMAEPELRSAITGPAAEAHMHVDPELVDKVVQALSGPPGSAQTGRAALPLVSEVMRVTWEYREGDRLTDAAYENAGGVRNSVNNSAHRVYEGLEELQPVARKLFLRLTMFGEDGRATRRPASRDELYRATGGPRAHVDKVIEVFAAERLLVLERDKVEIPHDVLLESWEDFHGWLEEGWSERVIYGRLSADAESWHQHRKDRAYLYRGVRLKEIEGLRKHWEADPERYPPPSQFVTDFIRDSRKEEDARAIRLRRLLIGLTALTLAAVSAAAVAWIADRRARRDDIAVRAETSVAVSRQLAVEALQLDATDPFAARQLATAAWAVSGTAQAGQTEATLLGEQNGTIITPDRTIYSVDFSPDGAMIATAGGDGSVRLWNPVTQRQIGAAITAAESATVAYAVFSPDGTLLATCSDKGAVSLWNVKTHQQVGATITATDNGSAVLKLTFSPSGKLLATAGADGSVRLWNPLDGKPVGPAVVVNPDGTAASSVAFSPDGTRLAIGNADGTLRLWNIATRRQVGRAIAVVTNGAVGAIFNPQGTLLATAGTDGNVRLWNAATLTPIGSPIKAASGLAVLNAAFNPEGNLLATAGADGTVRLWNPENQQQVGATMAGSGSKTITWSVAFNPSGTLLATASSNGTVRLWNPATQQKIASTITASGNGSALSDVAFDPSGTLLATAGGDRYLRLWDPVSQQQVGHPMAATDNGSPATGVAFSPSGALVATAGGDGAVRLWNPTTQQQAGAAIPAAPQAKIVSIGFNDSGTMLATGDDRGIVRLWNPESSHQIGNDIVATDYGSRVTGVAFSPSGVLLATAGGDGSVRLWNPTNQQQVGTTINAHAVVSHLTFSPSGALLATADGDGTVRLWNPTNQQQVGAAITVGDSVVWDIAFSPRGDMLATADAAGNVRFWSLATGTSLGNSTVGNSDGAALRVAFNPQGTVLATANGNGTATLINVSERTAPHRYLCDEFGLPPIAVWAQYVDTSVAEPEVC